MTPWRAAAANFSTLDRVIRAVFRAELHLFKKVLVDEIMNLALANAELTSGFAVSKQDRKGFVAVHAALLCSFANKDASRAAEVQQLRSRHSGRLMNS